MGSLNMELIRRQILLNTPHLRTINYATSMNFDADLAAKVKHCIINFEPIWHGSGEASPDNVRTFSGWNQITTTFNNTNIITQFPTLIYGGSLDLVTGQLTCPYVLRTQPSDVTSRITSISTGNGYTQFWLWWDGDDRDTSLAHNAIKCCNYLHPEPFLNATFNGIRVNENYPKSTVQRLSTDLVGDTKESIGAYLNVHPIEFIDTVATPVYYTLTPEQLKTVRGNNTISNTNAVDLSLTYWTYTDLVGYSFCDYIQTVGTASFIDTGVAGNDITIQIDLRVQPLEYKRYAYVFANYDGESKTCWRLIHGSPDNGRYAITLNNRRAGASASLNTGLDHLIDAPVDIHMEYGSSTATYNDESHVATSATDESEMSALNITIGKNRVGSGVGDTSAPSHKFYYFKIKKQNELIRYYIPVVRNTDKKAGFYDLVNKTFNPSIGNAEFIAGYDN